MLKLWNVMPLKIQDMMNEPENKHSCTEPFMGRLPYDLSCHQQQEQYRHNKINADFGHHLWFHCDPPLKKACLNHKAGFVKMVFLLPESVLMPVMAVFYRFSPATHSVTSACASGTLLREMERPSSITTASGCSS